MNNGAIDTSQLEYYSKTFTWVVNYVLVPALIALAFIVFLWGIYKYFILGASNEHEKGDGRKFALWGVIGFVIIFSLWGLVNLVGGTLNLFGQNSPTPPIFGAGSGAPAGTSGAPNTGVLPPTGNASPFGNPTTGDTYQTCIDNGGEPAQCQCEAGGGAWEPNQNVCAP